ncbi:MAG: MaoC family dehydratase [Hyphomicrobiales bacterium]
MSHFEDYNIGDITELGSYTFSAEDIVRFASAYDPQGFHLSDEAAAASHFGRLSASGWHTAAVWMKLMVAFQKRHAARLLAEGLPVGRLGPSPGVDDMRWLKPVSAGDTVTYSCRVTSLTESRSRPEWGLMTMLNEGVNQHGEVVFTFVGHVFVERRPG